MTENKEGYKETMTWTRLLGLSRLKTRLSPLAVWVNSKRGQKGKEATDLSQINPVHAGGGQPSGKKVEGNLHLGPTSQSPGMDLPSSLPRHYSC